MNETAIRNLERRAASDRATLLAAQPAVSEFKRLEKSGQLPLLMKGAVDAANLTQGSAISNSSFSALIPQDVSHMVYSTMLKREERCVLLQNLEREPVKQVRRERVIKKRHGNPLIPVGMGERSLPGVNRPLLDRIVATVQYYGVMSTLTHVAEFVNVIQGQYPVVAADGEGGLRFERESAIESLAEKLELVYWHGDNDFDVDEGDGFFRQMADTSPGINLIDLENQYLTFDLLIDKLAGLMRMNYEGKPSALYLPTELWAPLAKEAAGKNRLDPARGGGATLVWNKDMTQLLLVGPTGQRLELRHALFVSPDWKTEDFPADGQLGTDYWAMTEANLVGSSLSSPTGASVSLTSKFATADAGDYVYKFLPIFKKGHQDANTFTCTSVSVAAGDVVKADFNDSSFASTLVGYHWWRSAKNSMTVFHYGGKFGRNADGASAGTLWYDTNAIIPGTHRAAAIHHGDGAITDDVLLDSFQDDMGRIERERRFVVGTYRGISINMRRKHLAIVNARGISF